MIQVAHNVDFDCSTRNSETVDSATIPDVLRPGI